MSAEKKSKLNAVGFEIPLVDGAPPGIVIKTDGSEAGDTQALEIAEEAAARHKTDLAAYNLAGEKIGYMSRNAKAAKRTFGYSDIPDDKWEKAFGKKRAHD